MDEKAGLADTDNRVAEKNGGEVQLKGDPNDIEAALGKEAIIAEQGEEAEGVQEEVASMSRLWEYNKSEWAYILLGVIGGVVVGVLPPCEGILFGKMTSNFFMLEPDPMRQQNLVLSLSFFALAGAAILGNIAVGVGFSVSGFRLARRLRVTVFEKIVRHSIGWFDFSEHSTGEVKKVHYTSATFLAIGIDCGH